MGTKRRRLEREERGPWMERKLTKSSRLGLRATYPSNVYGRKEKRVLGGVGEEKALALEVCRVGGR